ncbi:hypothetical protein [Haloarchaeobius sp. DT45]|uniref:hypothetical protein n=1 Tax=Haloarchaeobius sp. DT45 TaxID=3446116 RepID=UPI003F6ACA90
MNPFLADRRLQFVFAWHTLALAVAAVVSWDLFVPLAVWTVVAAAVLRYRPGPYLPVALGLAVAEETLIYAFGGGLQGAARSLWHDYAVAMPTFAALVGGWVLVSRRYDLSPPTVFLLAGSHGLFLELGLTGLAVSPSVAFLLGGPVLVIYGSVVAGPALPRGEQPASWRVLAGGWLFVLALLVVAGVVADHLGPLAP